MEIRQNLETKRYTMVNRERRKQYVITMPFRQEVFFKLFREQKTDESFKQGAEKHQKPKGAELSVFTGTNINIRSMNETDYTEKHLSEIVKS